VTINAAIHTETVGRLGLFVRRAVASAIDAFLCVVAPFMLIGSVAVVVPEGLLILWPLLLIITILTYIAGLSARGATLGMFVTQLRLERAGSQGRPGILRGLLRGVIVLLGAASAIMLLMFGFSDPPPGGYDAASLIVLALALAVFVTSILGRLWMLVDRQQRTLFDRMLGLAVVFDPGTLSVTPKPSKSDS
jgi:hypothetical protein